MDETTENLQRKIDSISTKLASNFYSTVQILKNLVATTEGFYEGSHSRYISEKAGIIAMELGMNRREVMEVKFAALLHDVGKIGLPKSLLSKQSGELTGEMKKQYLMHSEFGFNLLRENPNFTRIAAIIHQHHEKLDGSGFPRHLRTEAILAGAKIIAPIDYYHNAVYKMTRQQSNKASFTNYSNTTSFLENTRKRHETTIENLKRKSGIVYEKKVVSALIYLLELERKNISVKDVVRIPYNNIEEGMVLADDYRTEYGMLITAKGETVTKEMITSLKKFVLSGELPNKILVMK